MVELPVTLLQNILLAFFILVVVVVTNADKTTS
jgi:hypothetical protein